MTKTQIQKMADAAKSNVLELGEALEAEVMAAAKAKADLAAREKDLAAITRDRDELKSLTAQLRAEVNGLTRDLKAAEGERDKLRGQLVRVANTLTD